MSVTINLNGIQQLVFPSGVTSAVNVGDTTTVTLSASGALLQTNSVTNTVQSLMNVVQGSGMTISSDSAGNVTFATTAVVTVNSVSVSSPNFNDTTPAAPASAANVFWQKSGSNVSAYISLNNVALTGSPTAPNQTPLSDNSLIANTKYVDDAVATVVVSGALAPQQNSSHVTAALAYNAIENFTLFLAKSCQIQKIVVSSAARVRIYQTSAARTADASRSNQVPPTAGAANQVIGDWFLDGSTNGPLTFPCSPTVLAMNMDGPPQTTAIYFAVTNLTATGTTAVTVTIYYVAQQS